MIKMKKLLLCLSLIYKINSMDHNSEQKNFNKKKSNGTDYISYNIQILISQLMKFIYNQLLTKETLAKLEGTQLLAIQSEEQVEEEKRKNKYPYKTFEDIKNNEIKQPLPPITIKQPLLAIQSEEQILDNQITNFGYKMENLSKEIKSGHSSIYLLYEAVSKFFKESNINYEFNISNENFRICISHKGSEPIKESLKIKLDKIVTEFTENVEKEHNKNLMKESNCNMYNLTISSKIKEFEIKKALPENLIIEIPDNIIASLQNLSNSEDKCEIIKILENNNKNKQFSAMAKYCDEKEYEYEYSTKINGKKGNQFNCNITINGNKKVPKELTQLFNSILDHLSKIEVDKLELENHGNAQVRQYGLSLVAQKC
jgi:hypothetical protein